MNIFFPCSVLKKYNSFHLFIYFFSHFNSCSSITITTSCFPVPSICFRDPVNDWFESLAQCLHWNVRKKQNYLSSEDEEFWGLLRGLLKVLVLAWPFSVPFFFLFFPSFTDRRSHQTLFKKIKKSVIIVFSKTRLLQPLISSTFMATVLVPPPPHEDSFLLIGCAL